jgi:hypothetical protein
MKASDYADVILSTYLKNGAFIENSPAAAHS